LENEKIKKLLKKVFKLLELGKNSDKEYFRPQGYESIKTKMQNLAKRATSKDKDAPKTARESVSRSDASKSDNSDEDSEDDDDMELEDDIENDDSNKIKNELGGLKTDLRAKPKSKPVVQGDALKVNANITSGKIYCYY
jgi:hypothetical protein